MPSEPFAATTTFDTLIAAAPRALSKPAPKARPHRSTERRELRFLACVLWLLALAAAVARSGGYAAGSNVGYWLGVAGGIAILLLFLYPLRKYWRPARNMGTTRFWFALHMTLGIAGPLLIVLHSTLKFGSVNATVAFTSMVLVASSGVIGRFLYRRIHHGLYGRRATLVELQTKLGLDAGRVHSRLAFAPQVEQRLMQFAREAEVAVGFRGFGNPVRFVMLGYVAMRVRRECATEVVRLLKARALSEAWTKQKRDRRTRSRVELIAHYVRAIREVAQFGAYERLFSWWHLLHVPLIYMLVFSAIAHVIAVHMY